MIAAVVFGFCWTDGLAPVVGAAPWDVLARQLPRLLVVALNGGDDRGARFFPFLGSMDGKRSFLHLRELLPQETLASLHKQGEVQCLVDGALLGAVARLRVHDGTTGRCLFDGEIPFEPLRPLEALRRMQFEIMGALGWTGRPMPPPALQGEALSWFLIARDELLAIEANLLSEGDPLRALRRCVELAPDAREVQETAVEFGAQLVRLQTRREPLGELLAALAPRPEVAAALRRKLAGLLHACGHTAATAAWMLVAQQDPQDQDAVERAAGLLFREGRLDLARELLEQVRAVGALSVSALAQLAAVADRTGDRRLRDDVCGDLLRASAVPVPVARLLVSFLFEMERVADARRVIERALQGDAQQAPMWLEHGRACLLLDDLGVAAMSLRRALALGLPQELGNEAQRLLRLSAVPGLLRAMQASEAALREQRPRDALRAARRIVRQAGDAGDAWLLLGVVRHKLQQEWRAERALRQAIALDPDLAEAHNRLGILLVGRGRVDEGYAHLSKAEQLAPTDPSPQLHLAQACVVLGRRDEGRQHLDRAAQLGANPKTLAAVREQFFAA
ncbi:MAG: tetratricopeptide repeat protein [Planctomycetes bacterium]|nr:tetratricopeptide repeat protein [Planctomycetota bacterium]